MMGEQMMTQKSPQTPVNLTFAGHQPFNRRQPAKEALFASATHGMTVPIKSNSFA
jgi:hypothetical protein